MTYTQSAKASNLHEVLCFAARLAATVMDVTVVIGECVWSVLGWLTITLYLSYPHNTGYDQDVNLSWSI
jgi:hypothetical protein